MKDREGREWDVLMRAAMRFEFVKDEGAKHGGVAVEEFEDFRG